MLKMTDKKPDSSLPVLLVRKVTTKEKKCRAKSTHPGSSNMVNLAILNLKEKGGSSLHAIKKYISNSYEVDVEKHAAFIRRYIRIAVTNGTLVRTKGKGAAGSFRLPIPKIDSVKAVPIMKRATAKELENKKLQAKKKVSISEKNMSTGEKKTVSKGPAAKPPKAKKPKALPKKPDVDAKPRKPAVKKAAPKRK